ncbi:MAG: winged helix-turn-helix domain-containing protein [Dictyoglomaceae bacterium]
MAITERRRQFLDTLRELYKEKKRPIHYYEIAKRVNVSPATAYDILQLLYKEGYVETVYEEALRKRGRKKVFFKPKEEKDNINELTNIDKANPFLLCISFLLFLLKKIKWSEDLKNYLLFILGSLRINTEVILLIIPLLILGYIGKNIFQGLNKEKIKSSLEDYWKALSNLAEEEKKALYNLVFSTIKSI